MKISFRGEDHSQKSVMMTQTEMKNYKSRKVPVLKLFLIVLFLIAALYIIFMLYTRNKIYTYGIVSGNTELVIAAFPTEIQTIRVKKGDIVKQNDHLFTQFSIDGASQINAAESSLKNKMNELTLVTSAIKKSSANPSKPDYPATLKKEIDLLQLKRKVSEINQERLINDATYERKQLKTLYKAKKEQYDNILKLYQLDATTLFNVKATETEKQLRLNDYKQAQSRYERILKKSELDRQQEQLELQELETRLLYDNIKLQTSYETLLADIRSARIQVRQFKKKYGNNDYRAPFDAIITEVNANKGSVVSSGEQILSLISLNKLWVDVYVAADKTAEFSLNSDISLFAGGSRKSIPGKLSEKGMVQLRVPQLLSEYLPGISSAVYFNVSFENKGSILPGNIVKVVVQ